MLQSLGSQVWLKMDRSPPCDETLAFLIKFRRLLAICLNTIIFFLTFLFDFLSNSILRSSTCYFRMQKARGQQAVITEGRELGASVHSGVCGWQPTYMSKTNKESLSSKEWVTVQVCHQVGPLGSQMILWLLGTQKPSGDETQEATLWKWKFTGFGVCKIRPRSLKSLLINYMTLDTLVNLCEPQFS